MLNYLFCVALFAFSWIAKAQTTDLSISVEAQALSGGDISQVHIYEEFQYLVTISNSGNSVANSSVSIQLNPLVTILGYVSQNATNGASSASNFDLTNNLLTATLPSMPSNSSIEIKIVVKAPETVGGIAINTLVSPPDGTTDVNEPNNQSIISIDVTDITIDFSVTLSQITPLPTQSIASWGDMVTYHVTITNNSGIVYPINGFTFSTSLNTPSSYGKPFIKFISAHCINSSNGTICPGAPTISGDIIEITGGDFLDVFNFEDSHEFSVDGSFTFELVYQFLEPECAESSNPIETKSRAEIFLSHNNISPNVSNQTITKLIEADICPYTDVCMQTVQIDPPIGSPIVYGQTVTFETTFCNNGPLDADIIAYFQNQSANIEWTILSITCLTSSGPNLSCGDVFFANAGNYWISSTFTMPVGETMTVETVVQFLEPDCSLVEEDQEAMIRSGVTLQSDEIIDIDPTNNYYWHNITLPPAPVCEITDLEVVKTQISPELPEGSAPDNTTDWGAVTYQIVVMNNSDQETTFELIDYLPEITDPYYTATLQAVECIDATGGATCGTISQVNIDIPFDGIPDGDEPDTFWGISFDDNWVLPAFGSITFEATVLWEPECSPSAIEVINLVEIASDPLFYDPEGNNSSSVSSYLAPCVDLIVQTFPEFNTVTVNQPFNWIIDITNSTTSSAIVDAVFENQLDSEFIINGTPSCEITNGTATCIPSFIIDNNLITGMIPYVEANSTIRIYIPVISPAFGGAFVNTAIATPDALNNREQTPETNTSISSVQVIAPLVTKTFSPEIIYVFEDSTLEFTVTNSNTSSEGNNISFIDELPNNLYLVSAPQWVESNGCTGVFQGNINDTYVGIENLSFPAGVTACTFSAMVTSGIPGFYINNSENFHSLNNIDATQVYAALEVLPREFEDVSCNVPQGFSPNNDMYNDYFMVPCLEFFTDNNLKIFNRYGTLVFEKEDYQNTWDGRPNKGILQQDSLLPVGTYYYVLEIYNSEEYKNPLVGWIYLNY